MRHSILYALIFAAGFAVCCATFKKERAYAASATLMACQDRMWRIEAEIDDLLDEQGGEA